MNGHEPNFEPPAVQPPAASGCALGMISVVAGLLVLFAGVGQSLVAPKAPWATALLLTATLLLGGWLILYPFRAKSGSAPPRYATIVILGIIVYSASFLLLTPVQDDLAFEQASKHGVQGYRDYLLDERNTRHRDEAKAKIAEFYKPVIALADQCPDENEKQAWKDLLSSLSQCEGLPVVSIEVVDENSAANPFGDLARQMRTWLADSLGSKFGPSHIVFVQSPDGVKPNLRLTYDFHPAEKQLHWQLTYRTTPDAPPVSGPRRSAEIASTVLSSFPPEEFQRAFYRLTFNAEPPTLHSAPAADGF